MTFDQEGHLLITPRQLLRLAVEQPLKLIDFYLVRGTPQAFFTYASYIDFLKAVSERIGVHPNNLFLRGSGQLGFSIAPRLEKAWMAMDPLSDLDLAIVDSAYFERIDQEVIRWEERNRAPFLQGRASDRFESRQRDRFYNCCRVDDLPKHLCSHHDEVMKAVAALEHCGTHRPIKAFVYRDWYSLRSRYEFDLHALTEGVSQTLPEPGDTPFPRVR